MEGSSREDNLTSGRGGGETEGQPGPAEQGGVAVGPCSLGLCSSLPRAACALGLEEGRRPCGRTGQHTKRAVAWRAGIAMPARLVSRCPPKLPVVRGASQRWRGLQCVTRGPGMCDY